MATLAQRENNLIPCPGCGSKELERDYSTSNIQVKSREAEAQERCKCCKHESCCDHQCGK